MSLLKGTKEPKVVRGTSCAEAVWRDCCQALRLFVAGCCAVRVLVLESLAPFCRWKNCCPALVSFINTLSLEAAFAQHFTSICTIMSLEALLCDWCRILRQVEAALHHL